MHCIFIFAMKKNGMEINRKMLSEIAIHDPKSFTALTEKAKEKLA